MQGLAIYGRNSNHQRATADASADGRGFSVSGLRSKLILSACEATAAAGTVRPTGAPRQFAAGYPVANYGYVVFAGRSAAEAMSLAWSDILYGLVVLAVLAVSALAIVSLAPRQVLAPLRALQETPVADRFFHLSPDLFCIATIEGRFLRLNAAWEQTLGYSIAELLAMNTTELIHPDDRGQVEATVPQLLSGDVVRLEVRFRTREGPYRWLATTITPSPDATFFYGVARDITDAKRAQTALMEANAMLRAVIEASPMPIMAVDRDYRVRIWNVAATKVFGWTEGEVLGRPLPIVPPESMPESLRHRETLFRGEPIHRLVLRRQRRDGSFVDVLGSAVPLKDPEHGVWGSMLVYEDITERTRFLKIAGHELRNPLATIKGTLTLLRRRAAYGRPAEEIVQTSRMVEREVDYVAGLINDILQAFQVQEGRLELNLEPTDLVQIVHQAIAPLLMLEGADRFRLDGLDQSPVIVLGDRRRLQEVLLNLLSNAVKYSPEGSLIQICLHQNRRAAVLAVANEGAGIPPDQQSRIFEPFYRVGAQAGRDPGGLGLGLFVCRDIIQRHGGSIRVESEAGRGATFYVTLPLADSSAPDVSEPI